MPQESLRDIDPRINPLEFYYGASFLLAEPDTITLEFEVCPSLMSIPEKTQFQGLGHASVA